MSRKFAVLMLALGMMPRAIWAEGPAVSATHVWIREATTDTTANTGYLILKNLSDQPLTLVKVSSPDFDSVIIRNDAVIGTKDKPLVPELNIAAHKTFTFAPDTYYLLLTKPVRHLYDGDLVTLTMTFSDHSSLTIMAPLRHDQPGS